MISTDNAREHENYQITQDYGKEFILILVAFLAIKRPQEESAINSTLQRLSSTISLLRFRMLRIVETPTLSARIEA